MIYGVRLILFNMGIFETVCSVMLQNKTLRCFKYVFLGIINSNSIAYQNRNYT